MSLFNIGLTNSSEMNASLLQSIIFGLSQEQIGLLHHAVQNGTLKEIQKILSNKKLSLSKVGNTRQSQFRTFFTENKVVAQEFKDMLFRKTVLKSYQFWCDSLELIDFLLEKVSILYFFHINQNDNLEV